MKIEHAKELWSNSDVVARSIALKYYSKAELEAVELPESWEDLKIIEGYFIDEDSKIADVAHNLLPSLPYNKNIATTKELSEAVLSVIMLTQLMKVYNGGWIADWADATIKYAVGITSYEIIPDEIRSSPYFLAFQTKEKRDHFLKHHIDLIKEAAPILFGVSFASGEAEGVRFVEGVHKREIEREGFVIELENGSFETQSQLGVTLGTCLCLRGVLYHTKENALANFGNKKAIHKLTIYTDGSHDLEKVHETK